MPYIGHVYVKANVPKNLKNKRRNMQIKTESRDTAKDWVEKRIEDHHRTTVLNRDDMGGYVVHSPT